MDAIVLSAIVATIGTIVVGIGGAILGRRWGLPGLGREVQQQQASLIVTMQAELAELRAQAVTDDQRIRTLEAEAKHLQKELSDAERRIDRQRTELLDLYRQMGKKAPSAF
jgi:chromosome segregation ATPase